MTYEHTRLPRKPVHIIDGALTEVRKSWPRDGSEGESVHALCDEIEYLREDVAALRTECRALEDARDQDLQRLVTLLGAASPPEQHTIITVERDVARLLEIEKKWSALLDQALALNTSSSLVRAERDARVEAEREIKTLRALLGEKIRRCVCGRYYDTSVYVMCPACLDAQEGKKRR